MSWLYWRFAAIKIENRGNKFNRRYLTCQISAILYADRGDRRKSQSLHRAHLAIFADRGDRRIKSPSVLLALGLHVICNYQYRPILNESVIACTKAIFPLISQSRVTGFSPRFVELSFTYRRYSNLVPRFLRLFGQRVGARRDSEEFENIKFFDWLPRNSLHCFTAEILRK